MTEQQLQRLLIAYGLQVTKTSNNHKNLGKTPVHTLLNLIKAAS